MNQDAFLQELAELEELDRLEKSLHKPTSAKLDARLPTKQEIATGIKSGSADIARGFLKGMEGMEAISPAGQLNRIGEFFQTPGRLPMFMEGVPEKVLPTPADDGTGRKYTRAFLEGVGGMAAGPGRYGRTAGDIAKNILRQSAAGGTGNLGAQATGNVLRDAGFPQEVVAPAEVLAGGLSGGAAGLAFGPRLRMGERGVNYALEGTTPEQFDLAQALLDAANRSGARTITAAELFPSNPNVQALGEFAAQKQGGNALRQRIAGRDQDLLNILEMVKSRIGPEADRTAVANNLSDSANAQMEALRATRGQQFRDQLAGVRLRGSDASDMYRTLTQLANNQQTPEAAQAYRVVAARLLNANPVQNRSRYITSVAELSLALKALKQNPPSMDASTSTKISREALDQPIRLAERMLGRAVPDFDTANVNFRNFTRTEIDPLRTSTIGRLADRNPNLQFPTPASRMGAVTEGNTPQTIEATLAALQDPNAVQILQQRNLPAPRLNAQALARAIVSKQTEGAPRDFPTAIRGRPGSELDARFNALLRGSGVDPAPVNEGLDTAALMQGFQAPATPLQAPKGALETLGGTMRAVRIIGQRGTEARYYDQIARLLANPNAPGALAKLREIAMFDPTMRDELTRRAMLTPAMQVSADQE